MTAMQVYETSRFGIIEVAPDKMITVLGGLLGFTNYHKYTIIPHGDGTGPFFWFQSLERPDLAFPLIDPHRVYPDYLLEISREEADELRIVDPRQVTIFVVVALDRPAGRLRLNMQGPLVVNRPMGLARQIIDVSSSYPAEIVLETAH